MKNVFIKIMYASFILMAVSTDARSTQQQCFSDVQSAYAYLKQVQQKKNNAIININTASASELMTLQGIGVKTAEAIIFYREHMGEFKSIEDLEKVKGIGKKTLDNNRHRLSVQ